MRATRLLATVILTALVSFFAGVFLHVGDPVVYVVVHNQASRAISKITIEHAHGSARSLKPIGVGDTDSIRFWAYDETNFSCSIELVGQAPLKCEGGYAEAGYLFEYFVSDSGVQRRVDYSYGLRPGLGQ
jgi:hypothetical protein